MPKSLISAPVGNKFFFAYNPLFQISLRGKGAFYASHICVFLSIFSILAAEQRPSTFTSSQEIILAKNPRVLAFLFHMTRNRLTFEEMAEKFGLSSVPNYYQFLVKNELIRELKDGGFEYLFLDPCGVWKFRFDDADKDGVICQLRKKGLERLAKIIEDQTVHVDDTHSPVWTVNTTLLTPEQFQEYKSDILRVCGKYIELGQFNLLHGTEDCQVVWTMQLGTKVPEEIAKKSHLMFGEVGELDELNPLQR